jgi:hypothetical protein
MTQKRTFVLELKNDKAVTLEFTPIESTGNRLWQMFATTEALETLEQLNDQSDPTETKSARKTVPSVAKSVAPTAKKKK